MTVNRIPADETDLLDLLRDCLAALPLDLPTSGAEIPAAVVDGATWVHDWLNMDAELAELTFDSIEDVELAGIRSSGSLRELTFVSGAHTIEIEIVPGARTVEVSGTVDPVTAGAVRFVVGGEVFAGEVDDAGRFAVPGVPHGMVLPIVETPAGRIRLGSFEV